MAASVTGILHSDLSTKIKNSQLLIVGAGGIGCEVLKNCVLSGFKNITIIDLDTIELSNLNRQFLFHKEHVGRSKAEVARESALKFNPNVEIRALCDSILNADYGTTFFNKFDLVLSALDNKEARNHVNRMCLTTDVPLIESGTAGYNGQVELIKHGLTECYECIPKSKQKTYPGCTIRNTPSEPIHCIVWAKHLFNQLFGEYNADEDVSPDTADPEANEQNGNSENSEKEGKVPASNEKGNIDRVSTRKWAEESGYDPEKLFNKFFHDDIKYLLVMSNLWKTRTPPKPAKWGELDEANTSEIVNNNNVLTNQKVWNLLECANIFEKSILAIREEFSKLKEGDSLVWDKDDASAMSFVAACANIRAHIFGIAKKSLFDIKSMAGNIIPAIATTNAITAGFVVLHAFKVLRENYDSCQSVYIRLRPNPRNQIFIPDKSLSIPNPNCAVCSKGRPEIILKIDTAKTTVKELKDWIFEDKMGIELPEAMLEGKGLIVISSEEDEQSMNDDKKLQDLGIVDGCVLKVEDIDNDTEERVIIINTEFSDDCDERFNFNRVVAKKVPVPITEKPEESSEKLQEVVPEKDHSKHVMEVDEDDDDICLVEEAEEVAPKPDLKRKIVDHDDNEPAPSKKSRTMEVDDDDDDLIIIN